MNCNRFHRLHVGLLMLSLSAFCLTTHAISLTIDEVLYEAGEVSNPSSLSGTATASLSGSGNVLSIILQNTSGTDGVKNGSGGLLTGIGFVLPSGLAIDTGAVHINAGSSAVNFPSGFSGTDLSKEWGYDNDPITKGHYLNPPAILKANTVVSSMIADVDAQFQEGSIDKAPQHLNGPSFGVISQAGDSGGVEAIEDSVIITLNLTGSYSGDLLSFMESNPVLLTFGSPDSSAFTLVPDGGVTGWLLGCSVLGMMGFMRRRTNVDFA